MAKKITIIIQARMGSQRLPGKTLKKVLDKPLLEFVVERAQRSKLADEVIVATTIDSIDDPIASFCHQKKITCFRGSPSDVLARYVNAASTCNGDIIVRITGDCPLIDPEIIDNAIQLFLDSTYDYVANTLERTYPRGLDVEVFSRKSLQQISLEATSLEEREHVTLFYYTHPEKFKLGSIKQTENLSHLRLTVDTQEDFDFIKKILENLYPNKPNFTTMDVLEKLKAHPEWVLINRHIEQKPIKQ